MSNLSIQVPGPVLERVRALAESQKVTIDQFVTDVLENATIQEEWWQERVRRGKLVTREQVLAILDKVSDVPPMPGDELPEGYVRKP